MKFKELQSKANAELEQDLVRLKKELHELSSKLRLGQVKNVRQAQGLRKDIARILTLLSANKVESKS